MKNKKYIMYLVVSILVLTIGVSYAYFKARVSGEGKSISLRSKGIYVLYSGDATLASESISPGWSVTKEFTVENQGSNNEVYNIYIEGLVNTFVTSGYLQYRITSSNGYNMSEYKDIPKSNTSTDTVLAYSVPIKSKEKQTYKVELIYKETEEDQSVDMGKILSGILGIQVGTKDPNLFTASVVVINGSSDTNSKEVYKGNDVTFTITPNDGYTLEDASVSCSNGTLSNNLLTISNVQSNQTCKVQLGEEGPFKSGTLAAQILIDNSNIDMRTDFSKTNNNTTTGTLYVESSTSTSQMTEDIDGDGIGEVVYYFSGNHENNWVKFGKYTTTDITNSLWTANDDMYWRVIRINEDGSVRLLYSGIDPTTTTGYISSGVNGIRYSSLVNDPLYVGYMYGTSGSLEKNRLNTNSSTIKKYLDNWYEKELLNNYDKYISKTAIYCNDRAVGSGTYNIRYNSSTEYMFNYASYSRTIMQKGRPSYRCGGNTTGGLYESTQAIEDKFSASTTGGGNGQLTYSIALITADELRYAGVLYNNGARYGWYKLNSLGGNIGGQPDTMSPGQHSSGNEKMLIIYDGIGPTYGLNITDVDSSRTTRPVISLKSCVKYSSGDGTSTNPYEVTIDSACENSEN